jgi:hypothetical protein
MSNDKTAKAETKTEAPKSDIPRADSTPKTETPKGDRPMQFPNFMKMDLPFEQWSQLARENAQRLQTTLNAYWDELAGYENAMYERARAASADLANLAQESIAYVSALSAEFRRMSVEATKRVTDTFRA